MANFFFRLNSERFSIISRLRFDDYDLFYGEQIESLSHELIEVISINPSASRLIYLMLKSIIGALYLEKSILFDPFFFFWGGGQKIMSKYLYLSIRIRVVIYIILMRGMGALKW